ncbi:CPBP family intramembrane glutamic endopeptidase [Leifsonia poae]|uniref:CPBP family intramembrane glutamic endopeptidase n=1 Tax=Leifsonia poae TaxID=110933 RepID=UPI001CBECAEB|nr:CPBP family intramembrane glutamic endopeptidase [Leifsonia poae]
MPDHNRPSRWRAFWDHGTWWKALLVVVVYLALYLGAGQLSGLIGGSLVDTKNIFATPGSVFFALTFPLVIGAIVLAVFVASLGWFAPLFERQPIRGRWWMWIAVAIPVIAIVLRLFGIDYAAYTPGVVVLTMVTGLFVGFTEEVISRGIAVKLLRDSGMREWGVAVISSALFALMHATNLLSGMSILTVATTVGYTFCFGILMYLVLRVTGSLIWPILIHGFTDPSLFLSTGGIDQAGTTQNVFLALAGPANILTIVFAIIALIFIRGRVGRAGTVDGLTAPEATIG